jgi:hypothetical protein
VLQKVYIIGQLAHELNLRSANSDPNISDITSESSEFVRKPDSSNARTVSFVGEIAKNPRSKADRNGTPSGPAYNF